jgi:hypothetical protein
MHFEAAQVPKSERSDDYKSAEIIRVSLKTNNRIKILGTFLVVLLPVPDQTDLSGG